LSPQLSKISKIAPISASDTKDFLRLVWSSLEIVAAFGSNFSESVAAGAEFWLSEDRCASILSRSTHSVSKLRPKLHTERETSVPSVSSCDQTSTPIAIGANFLFFPEPMQFFPFKPNSSTPIAITAGLV
jgi:hypothetical protein